MLKDDVYHWLITTTHQVIDSIPNDEYYQITKDLKIKPHNLLTDCLCGIAKNAILYGKWGGAIKKHSQKKTSISTQYILSQYTLLNCFKHLDGYSNFTTIFDVFLKTHKYMLYNFFGKDEQWDNEILLNAILKYFPIYVPNHLSEKDIALNYKAIFLLINDIERDPNKLLDNAVIITQKALKIFQSKGIILFVKYMQSWKRYLNSKRLKEQIQSDTEEYSDQLNSNMAFLMWDMKPQSPIKNKKQFWQKILNNVTPLQTYLLQRKFIDNWDFETIARDVNKTPDEIEQHYQEALLILREKMPEYAGLVHSGRC